MSRTNERRHISWNETCTCKCSLDISVVLISNVRIMINADVNANIWLTELDVMINLFEILMYIMINNVMF